MFTPIKPGIIETIARGGTIEFEALEGWDRQAIKRLYFMGIPHKIVYHVENDEFSTLRWFDCRFSVLNKTIIVDDIVVSSTSSLKAKDKKVEKPLIHMALDLAVDATIAFALKYKKTKAVISSALPGFADVLLEKNFIIKSRDLFGNNFKERRFRGLRTL